VVFLTTQTTALTCGSAVYLYSSLAHPSFPHALSHPCFSSLPPRLHLSHTVLVVTIAVHCPLFSYYPSILLLFPPPKAVVLHRGQLLGLRGKWERSHPPAVVI